MKGFWQVSLLGVAVLKSIPLAAQVSTPVPGDSARLQGTWSMVSGSADGVVLVPEYVKTMKRVFVGKEVTVTLGETLFFRATIRLDTTRTPREIDYTMTGGPTTGSTQLGIYSIAGDTARFCFGSPGAPRPTTFTTAPNDGRTLSTWVRAKN